MSCLKSPFKKCSLFLCFWVLKGCNKVSPVSPKHLMQGLLDMDRRRKSVKLAWLCNAAELPQTIAWKKSDSPSVARLFPHFLPKFSLVSCCISLQMSFLLEECCTVWQSSSENASVCFPSYSSFILFPWLIYTSGHPARTDVLPCFHASHTSK